MSEGAWGARGVSGPMHPSTAVVAAYLSDLPVRGAGQEDAWTRTHTNIRINGVSRFAVHRLIDRWECNLATGCGSVVALGQATFTSAAVTCRHLGCGVRSEQNAERPAPVDRPGGAYQGGAANTSSRRDATGNSVADRTDRDPFRSVKSATDNRAMVGPIPRRQVSNRGADR